MICEICNMKIKMPKKILSSLIKKSTFEEITLPLCSLYYYQFLQQFIFFVSYSYASWWFNVHILTLSLSSAYFYYKLFLISQPKNCRSYFWKHSHAYLGNLMLNGRLVHNFIVGIPNAMGGWSKILAQFDGKRTALYTPFFFFFKYHAL